MTNEEMYRQLGLKDPQKAAQLKTAIDPIITQLNTEKFTNNAANAAINNQKQKRIDRVPEMTELPPSALSVPLPKEPSKWKEQLRSTARNVGDKVKGQFNRKRDPNPTASSRLRPSQPKPDTRLKPKTNSNPPTIKPKRKPLSPQVKDQLRRRQGPTGANAPKPRTRTAKEGERERLEARTKKEEAYIEANQ